MRHCVCRRITAKGAGEGSAGTAIFVFVGHRGCGRGRGLVVKFAAVSVINAC